MASVLLVIDHDQTSTVAVCLLAIISVASGKNSLNVIRFVWMNWCMWHATDKDWVHNDDRCMHDVIVQVKGSKLLMTSGSKRRLDRVADTAP